MMAIFNVEDENNTITHPIGISGVQKQLSSYDSKIIMFVIQAISQSIRRVQYNANECLKRSSPEPSASQPIQMVVDFSENLQEASQLSPLNFDGNRDIQPSLFPKADPYTS